MTASVRQPLRQLQPMTAPRWAFLPVLLLLLSLAACAAQAATIGVSVGNVSSNSVSLSWTPTGIVGLKSYDVSWFASGISRSKSVLLATSTTITGLTTGVRYGIRVKANTTGLAVYSPTVYATPVASGTTTLSAPTGLVATAVSSSQINLSWSDTSGETGFKIERSASATGTFIQVGTTGANITTFSNTGLTASTISYYRVRAYNSASNSGYSSIVSATTQTSSTTSPTVPTAPAGLVATAVSSSQINLNWSDTSSETGFKIERSASATGTFVQVGTTAANVTAFSNTALAASSTHFYRVRAYNATGNSGYSDVVSATTSAALPAAPAGLVATTVSSSQINLSWSDTSGETGFKIERSATATGPFAEIGTTAANISTFSNTALAGSSKYYYRVRAYNAAGNSGYSSVVSATTSPAAPSGLTATAVSSSQINLSWSDTSGETGFKIERSTSATGSFVQAGTTGANITTFSSTGLAGALTYYYRVYAYTSVGNSSYSNMASATTQAPLPTAPAGLAAVAVSASQINLSWSDTSSGETGFKIEQSASATGTFVLVGTTGANITTFSNTPLAGSTAYYYRVCAYNTTGNSGYSSIVSAMTKAPLPTAPTGLVATAVSTSQINLSWVDTSSGETGFKIERSATATGTFVQVGTAGANITTFSNTTLPVSTTYYYRVYAYASVGNSGYSNTVSATTQTPLPAAPTGLAATAVSASQINLSWSDTSSGETGFKIEQSTSATGTFVQVGTTGANVTTFPNTALPGSTTYYYRVCAYNTGGNSGFSNTANATTQTPLPTTPTGLAATAVSSSQIDLSWSDTSSGETGFKIERSASATGTFVQVGTTGANLATFSDTGLPVSTTYYYRVCAYASVGSSGYSGTVSATTQAAPLSAPTGLSVSAVSAGELMLTWIDTSPNEFGFGIERAPAQSGPFTSLTTVGAGSVNFTDSNLGEGIAYYYRVYAYGISGNSSYSNVASEKTKLKAPTNLTAAAAGPTTVTLTWTDNSSREATYWVERKDTGDWSVLIDTLPPNTTSYPDATCLSNTTYYYRVTAKGSTSDPSNVAAATTPPSIDPQWVGHVSTDHLARVDRCYDVALSNDYLYAASYPGLSIYSTAGQVGDVPAFVSHVDIVAAYSVAASVINGVEYAFVTSGMALKVVSLAIPTEPTIVASLELPTYGYRLCSAGNYVYVACNTAGLLVVDISDPANPHKIGEYDSGGQAWAVDVNGSHAALADGTGGLVMLDISDPAHLAYLGSLPLTGACIDVDLDGSTAWVAATGGIGQVDVSSASAPTLANYVPTRGGSVTGVCADGNYVFAACASSLPTWSGVQIIEVRSGSLDDIGFLQSIDQSALQVAARDRMIYLTDSGYLVDVATY